MTNEALIEQMYAAYDRQDREPLLAFVSEDVDWPEPAPATKCWRLPR